MINSKDLVIDIRLFIYYHLTLNVWKYISNEMKMQLIQRSRDKQSIMMDT